MHSIKEEPAGNPDESAIQAGLTRFLSLRTSLGCLAMPSRAKHLKDSFVAYMHSIQKVSAGNKVLAPLLLPYSHILTPQHVKQ